MISFPRPVSLQSRSLDRLSRRTVELTDMESAKSWALKLLVVMCSSSGRHVYEHGRPIWGAACQVSGQFDSEANQSSLPAPLGFRRSHKYCERRSSFLSRSKKKRGSLRKMTICAGKISQAAKWPIGDTRINGHRRLLRRVSNVWDSTLAGKWWLTLRSVYAGWRITGSSLFKKSFAFPSSNYFHRKFRILMRKLLVTATRQCPLPMTLKNPGNLRRNAQS